MGEPKETTKKTFIEQSFEEALESEKSPILSEEENEEISQPSELGKQEFNPNDLDDLTSKAMNLLDNNTLLIEQQFKRSILDQSMEYIPPKSILNIVQDGETFSVFTKKSFSLLQGKQKSKKTTVLAMMVAEIINPKKKSDNIRFECPKAGRVLFFDCEQGESYGARTMHLILKLADVLRAQGHALLAHAA
ncbi:MAG: hypothetical protein EOO61_06270 [Hymenobacter sp.]|nr:MAG: hypothetical protein EOO61_06270 [Hymenobacter sp.]